jgi:hypothetical protein
MSNAFQNAAWIWRKAPAGKDEFCDFVAEFDAEAGKNYTLSIAADSNYTVWLNGELAAFGQYADYPYYKVYDKVDVTKFVREGKNRMAITVWYYGVNSATYVCGEAGVIFEVTDGDGKVCTYSSEETPSRLSPAYEAGRCEMISMQLGLAYHYNVRRADGFAVEAVEGFERSRLVPEISTDFHLRPNQKLVLAERLPAKLTMMGVYHYIEPLCGSSANMQRAALSCRHPADLIGTHRNMLDAPVTFSTKPEEREGMDGVYFIVDLGTETSGFLDIDIEVPCDCRIDVGYGEHLYDGRLRTGIGNFCCDIEAKAGRNTYLHTFRRFGCRYVQVFVPAHDVTVHYAGIRPTLYPLTHKDFKCGNLLRETIYKTCEDTLQHCLHEHYEDCPWREQGLYVMDARNQMLCGYYAFGEYQAARASLELIAHGLREEGLLSLTYPAGFDLPIPSFSCMYIVQMQEYIAYSGDKTLAEQYYGVLETIMNTLLSKMLPEGVIEHFYGYQPYDGFMGFWNFYEWQPTMEGYEPGNREERRTAAPLNAFLSLAMQSMAKIAEALGKQEEAEKYSRMAKDLNAAIARVFYNPETKLFESYLEFARGEYSTLTQALCTACGAAEGLDTSAIMPILVSNGADNGGRVVYPNTLSMNTFRFDALLVLDREKYGRVILDELDRDYLYMLRRGATTFWETIEGPDTFDAHHVGKSLCHGWSALPIYYYEILKDLM